jgi:hypothetical protein
MLRCYSLEEVWRIILPFTRSVEVFSTGLGWRQNSFAGADNAKYVPILLIAAPNP